MNRSLLLLALTFASSLSAFAQQGGQPASTPDAKQAAHKNVTPDEAEKLIRDEKELIVLDVRTPDEFKEGHIAGAKNLSLLEADFDAKVKEYEGKKVILHCASGARSARALTKMRNLQFPEIYHMNGGMKAWQAAGKAVVKEQPAK